MGRSNGLVSTRPLLVHLFYFPFGHNDFLTSLSLIPSSMASRATLLFAFLSCLVLISISLFIASSSSSRIPSPNSDKVSLAFYYESLCPYCSRFIVNYLNDLVQDKELLSIVDLHLSPWGNTKILSNGTVVCQHGPDECLLDTVEVCAIDAWPKLEDHFPFVYCVENSVYEGRHKEWISCFEKLALDPKPVLDCVSNGYGKQLELKYAAETNALQPPHRYVPWVVVDGKPLYGDYENYISYICKAYKGTTVLKACSELSHDDILRREVKPQVCYKEKTISERINSAIAFLMRQMDRAAST